MKKTLQAIFGVVLALLLCFGSEMPVLATSNIGSETSQADASIKKVLEMPEGTDVPSATFTFVLTPKSVDGNTDATSLATMPAITSPTVIISADDTSTTENGVTTISKETGGFLSGVTFPHAGVYIYTVTEQSGTYTPRTGEIMTYSRASYDIEVYVDNGTNGLYIAAVNAVFTTADNASQVASEKVTPTPGISTIIFTNGFSTSSGGTDPASDSALTISKTVAGNYSDQTKYFTFKITFTKTSADATGTTYALYLFENGTIQSTISADVCGTISNDGTYDYILATEGTALSFNLKHNQYLSVLQASVGTTYSVLEAAAADYTPSVVVTKNGTATTLPGSLGSELGTGIQFITYGTDSAAYTNTYKTVNVPTGISMNMLPFILMLIMAIGALVLFVVVKSRKQTYNSND